VSTIKNEQIVWDHSGSGDIDVLDMEAARRALDVTRQRAGSADCPSRAALSTARIGSSAWLAQTSMMPL
jgi:hypothetical protein